MSWNLEGKNRPGGASVVTARDAAAHRMEDPGSVMGNPAAAGRKGVDFAQYVDAALENERLRSARRRSQWAKTLAIVVPSFAPLVEEPAGVIDGLPPLLNRDVYRLLDLQRA